MDYFVYPYQTWRNQKKYKAVLKQVAGRKGPLKVVFLVYDSSFWKCDLLFEKLAADPDFQPLICVIPYTYLGEEYQKNIFRKTLNFFNKKNYPCFPVWDEGKQEWKDLYAGLKPDIVYFTSPHSAVTLPQYTLSYFSNYCLTLYSPYSSAVCDVSHLQFYTRFHSGLWRFLFENREVQKLYQKKILFDPGHTLVTGLPTLDILTRQGEKIANPWKNPGKLKLIWAPHYTIYPLNHPKAAVISFSNFLRYADFMLEIAKKYKDKIQIAFKPHLGLKATLYEHPDWGKKKTDAYYGLWDTMPNTQLELDDYAGLFYHSDGMVFDSCSFMTEYLYTGKPGLFLVKEGLKKQLNDYGKQVFSQHYHAETEQDIIDFIDQQLIARNDFKASGRKEFVGEVLWKGIHHSSAEMTYQLLKNIRP